MSDSPVVTVVVPGFDVATYAEAALESLRSQTTDAWRAVLVDDASTDDTGRIFAAAAASDERFTVVTQPSRTGLGAARNAALPHIRTDYTAFLDADDVMAPDALRRTTTLLDETGSDLVVGAYVRLRPNDDGGYTAHEVQPWVRDATSPERHRTTIDEHPAVTGNIVAWSKVSRTDLWRSLRFPEGRLYEDQIVAQQMYTTARAIDVIPDVLVQWRVRADGSSITQREADPAVLRDCLDAMRDGLAVLDAGHPAAARARRELMLSMDVPRLAAIGDEHPDPAYRAMLGAFTRDVWAEGAAPDATRRALTW